MRAAALILVTACWSGTSPPPEPETPASPRQVPAWEQYNQRTPREALRSFVRAVERKRWDVVVRFVPDRYRDRVTAQTVRADWEGPMRAEREQLLARLRAHLDDPIRSTGDSASLSYDDRFQVTFVRESGVWKIRDLD